MSNFIYMLNAMESAGQSAAPALDGYSEKRKAVLEYVASIEDQLKDLQALRAALRTIEDTAKRANQGLIPLSSLNRTIRASDGGGR